MHYPSLACSPIAPNGSGPVAAFLLCMKRVAFESGGDFLVVAIGDTDGK